MTHTTIDSHVNKHEWDPKYSVHHRHGFPEDSGGGEVAVANGGEHCQGEHQGTAEGPDLLSGEVTNVAALDVINDLLLVVQHNV